LNQKIFISQKSLDTPLFRLIRFRQKVLTDFVPLELFSLKEEAAPLPGWPFYFDAAVGRWSLVVGRNEAPENTQPQTKNQQPVHSSRLVCHWPTTDDQRPTTFTLIALAVRIESGPT
ncbi:MAG: hypothetical protein ACRD3W_22295, partial [Terriglobales bacterium]